MPDETAPRRHPWRDSPYESIRSMAEDVERLEAQIRELEADPTPENLGLLERRREELYIMEFLGGAYLLGCN